MSIKMLSCRVCGCLCDPGDLLGGVCDDCREAQEQQNIRIEAARMILNSHFYQLELNLEEIQ